VPDVVCGIVRLDVPEAAWPDEVASAATTQVPGGGDGGGVSQAKTGTAMTRTARTITAIQRWISLIRRNVTDIHHSPVMSCRSEFIFLYIKSFDNGFSFIPPVLFKWKLRIVKRKSKPYSSRIHRSLVY
jgi:hypothetical protein